jgi:hypothetical protein
LKKIVEVKDMNKDDEILTAFNNGEWCNTEDICRILNITFEYGLHNFDFSRTAEWNKPPLNGQKITTKFKKKDVDKRYVKWYSIDSEEIH